MAAIFFFVSNTENPYLGHLFSYLIQVGLANAIFLLYFVYYRFLFRRQKLTMKVDVNSFNELNKTT